MDRERSDAMPQFHRASCRICGALEQAVPISGTGLCPECGERRHLENNAQMKAGSGPWFRYWRARSLATYSPEPVAIPERPQ